MFVQVCLNDYKLFSNFLALLVSSTTKYELAGLRNSSHARGHERYLSRGFSYDAGVVGNRLNRMTG